MENTIFLPNPADKKSISYVVPDSLETIRPRAFWDCSRLTFRAQADSYVEEYARRNEINFETIG